MKVKVKGPYPPVLVVFGEKKYAISGSNWIEVPVGMTLYDVFWDRVKPPKVEKVKEVVRVVPSSKGNKTYEVAVRSDGARSCTCSGFMYRRHCRHIDGLKKEMGW